MLYSGVNGKNFQQDVIDIGIDWSLLIIIRCQRNIAIRLHYPYLQILCYRIQIIQHLLVFFPHITEDSFENVASEFVLHNYKDAVDCPINEI